MIVSKPLDLSLLSTELVTAGVIVPGLGTTPTGSNGTVNLYTYDATGAAVELPPAAVPVVNAHVAPPNVVNFAASQDLRAMLRTTDATATILLRFPLTVQTGYDVQAAVMGVDAGNGAVKKLKVDVTMKRLNAGPLLVGTMTTLVNHADTAAAAWTVIFSFSGNDALVFVTGAAGRNIDWIIRATISKFAPAGL
jgi:hypothetical protein